MEKIGWLAVAFVAATLLAHVIAGSNQAETLRNNIQDEQIRQFAKPVDINNVSIIDIDDVSLNLLKGKYGSWPYPRNIFADLHSYLSVAGARSIVYTPLFVESRIGDVEFANAIKAGQPAVFAVSATNTARTATRDEDNQPLRDSNYEQQSIVWNSVKLGALLGLRLPEQSLLTANTQIGVAVRPISQEDEVFRSFSPAFTIGENVVASLPLAALLAGKPPMQHSAILHQLGSKLGESRELKPFFAPNIRDIERIPFWQAMLEVADYQAGKNLSTDFIQKLAGRTIIVGTSATLLDMGTTATAQGRLHTHELTAALLLALETDQLLHGVPSDWVTLFTLFVTLLPLLALLKQQHRRAGPTLTLLVIGVSTMVIIAIVHVGLFGIANWYFDPVLPILGIIFATILGVVYRYQDVAKKNQVLAIERRTAERASELKTQFLNNITHELRTPLTSVLGYNRVLLDDAECDTQEAERYHKIIDANCRHLLALINNLLSEAELEAGKVDFRARPMRSAEVLTEAVHTVEGLAIDKALTLHHSVAENVPDWLYLDSLRVKQVIINLASNAVKYTAHGHVNITMAWHPDATAVDSQMGTLEIHVKDTGPGMSKGQLQVLFKRFANRDAIRLDSSGLGLSICNELIDIMGGSMELQSEVGIGSTFSVYLPAPRLNQDELQQQGLSVAQTTASNKLAVDSAKPAFAVPADQSNAVTPSGASSKERATVLIVDDSEDIRMLLRLYLSKAGVDIVEAEDAEKALSILADQVGQAEQTSQAEPMGNAIDMIFMDIDLPGMSGKEAVAECRRKGYQMPIIMCSAAADMGDIAGASGYLPKPMRREEVISAVADHLFAATV